MYRPLLLSKLPESWVSNAIELVSGNNPADSENEIYQKCPTITMWLLNTNSHILEEFHGDEKPKYAILSHTWEKGEVSFVDVQEGKQASLQGWSKIQSCCEQALADDYAWVWVDTCCIDRRNIMDLSEAINSMFRWYKDAAVCYTYLSDVSISDAEGEFVKLTNPKSRHPVYSTFHAASRPRMQSDNAHSGQYDGRSEIHHSAGPKIIGSRWFTRGWTLQELLAPNSLIFYDASWTVLGTRIDYLSQIESRTSIPCEALQSFVPENYCIAQKMAWAAGRRTTRPEDRAYSLLGILGVSLSLIYGEGGEEAFFRLQKKLIKRLDDTSILLWSRRLDVKYSHWLLAPSPDAFEGCHIFQEYRSCAIGLDLNKTALMGTFDTRIDCFSVACACLGHFRKCLDEELPLNFRDERGLAYVNTVGLLLIEQPQDVYQRIVLDHNRHLLSVYPSQHRQHSAYWKKLIISPVSPERYQYKSAHAMNHQYLKRTQEKILTIICPGRLWPGGDKSDRESRLSRPMSHIDRMKHPRLYAPPAHDRDEPLIIRPGTEELSCFVISRPSSNDKGKVIQFGYDLTNRPTVREGQLRDRPSSTVLAVGAFQHVDTTKGLVEVASRQVSNDYLRLGVSITTAKQWADSSDFDQLVEDESKNEPVLPIGARILKLGDNVKVIFIPQDSGHRVLLAFRGNSSSVHSFPRAWLWPVQEVEAQFGRTRESKRAYVSFTERLKDLFKRN